ncbi:MAG: threonylcarbamoyl-AMP synthase [Clostridia bacterium]|nr:threonylcarbamoyl-AMP synthase [Clostridia bacterium]
MITETAVLTANNEENEKILSRAAEIIRSGGLVAFPTETVYGLGASALDADAAAKIYAAKGRPSDNPLIIHLAKASDAAKYAYVTDAYEKLAGAFMPGPLTVIMKKKENIPDTVTGGLDSVAVRVPSNPAARRLIELAGVPIAAPSANLSGKPSPTSAAHVTEDLNGRVDMIIDGGSTQIGLESTIIKLDCEKPTLLRPGRVTLEQLTDLFGEVALDKAVTQKLTFGERPLAPGMKYRHYAPSAPLTLVDGTDEDFIGYVIGKSGDGVAVIACDEDKERLINAGFMPENVLTLGARADVVSHAASLFALLRTCDERNFTNLYAKLPAREGLSLALYNRIIKAAGYNVITVTRK